MKFAKHLIILVLFVSFINIVNAEDEIAIFVGANNSDIPAVVEELKEIVGEDKIRYEFEDRVSVDAPFDKLEEISQISGIYGIGLVEERKLFLQDTKKQINASITHPLQNYGINLTGIGETVCIFDSGVNYNHPALGGCYGNNEVNSSCKIIGGYDFVNNDDNPLDDNGHGTNVAGVISGIAPDAKILILKVCDASGNCADDVLMKAFDWCIGNKSKYNVSVISMSLGSGLYKNNCDNEDALTDWIDEATDGDISVIIASGNDGSTEKISSPACVKNAIPVAGILKDDSTINYNRNKLVELVAPGQAINTTSFLGGYVSVYGTSFSAPHVAGSFLITNQFLREINSSKKPKQIEQLFKEKGKSVYDSGSKKTYSRPDIYSTILSLDDVLPQITQIYPLNNSVINETATFTCNASDNLKLVNVTLKIFADNNYEETKNISENGNIEFNVTMVNVNSGKWQCLARDLNNNLAYTENWSFSVVLNKSIFVSLDSPVNNSFFNFLMNFSCSASSSNDLKNSTFYLWNSSSLIYSSILEISGLQNQSEYSYDFSNESDKIYYWNCLFFDVNSSSQFFDYNYTLTLDNELPVVSSIFPVNNTSGTPTYYNFTFNATDNLFFDRCELLLDDIVINALSVITAENGMENSSIAVGTHSWKIKCFDKAGNFGQSEERKLVVEAAVVVDSGGSSGGGGGGGGGSVSSRTIASVNNTKFNTSKPLPSTLNPNLLEEKEEIREGVEEILPIPTLRSRILGATIFATEKIKGYYRYIISFLVFVGVAIFIYSMIKMITHKQGKYIKEINKKKRKR